LPEISNLVSLPDEFSFPSGHTAAAFLMATILGAFYPVMVAPGFIIATFVGVSRIYNGVHFPADVVVGSVIGILSAKIGLVIML
jgi:undecaprenyl-diphosphatase